MVNKPNQRASAFGAATMGTGVALVTYWVRLQSVEKGEIRHLWTA